MHLLAARAVNMLPGVEVRHKAVNIRARKAKCLRMAWNDFVMISVETCAKFPPTGFKGQQRKRAS
jgi:hypothetical protein